MSTYSHHLLPGSPLVPIAIYAIMALLIILEVGFIFGFFFPGDFLLIGAGILAGSYRDLTWRNFIITAASASFLGAESGFFIGKRYGFLLARNNNPPSMKKTIEKSKRYLAENEWGTVLVSNFIPGLRSFVPITAGQRSMGRLKFLSANAIGSTLWALLFISIGYKLADINAIRESPFVLVAGLFLLSTGASIVNFFRAM